MPWKIRFERLSRDNAVSSTGWKLACLLIQLPPSYNYNPENLEAFFQKLQPQFKFAVEFRNLSWMRNETWELLKKYGVAYANVDEPLLPPEVHLTADFAYFRWHGKGKRPWFNYKYEEKELEQWYLKITAYSDRLLDDLGELRNWPERVRVMQQNWIGKSEGKMALGDAKVPAGGYFIPATIFTGIKPDARLAQEEIFGPVLVVIKGNGFDELLAIANGTEYGLTGAIYSNDRTELERARHDFHVGNLYLNRKCTGASWTGSAARRIWRRSSTSCT
jgi:hypothetical protein